MICISLKLLTKTSRNEFQLHEFVEYSAFILRRFPVNVVLSPCPRRREQFNYCCRVTVLRFFLLLSLLLLCLEFKLIETVCFSQGSMRPIITELDNNKKGSIRTDVADLVLVKYVFRAHAFHRAHDFTPNPAHECIGHTHPPLPPNIFCENHCLRSQLARDFRRSADRTEPSVFLRCSTRNILKISAQQSGFDWSAELASCVR